MRPIVCGRTAEKLLKELIVVAGIVETDGESEIRNGAKILFVIHQLFGGFINAVFHQILKGAHLQGQLFAEDIYENYIDAFQNRETVVKALCLHIAHDCNLACKYCFAGEGEYHGRRALMSLEVGRKRWTF